METQRQTNGDAIMVDGQKPMLQVLEREDGPGSGSHSRLYSGLIVIGTVIVIGALNDFVPIYTSNRIHSLQGGYHVKIETIFALLNINFRSPSHYQVASPSPDLAAHNCAYAIK